MSAVILYKSRNSYYFLDITRYVNELPSWTDVYAVQPREFSLSINQAYDNIANQDIIFQAGDYILVAPNSQFVGEAILFGEMQEPTQSLDWYDKSTNLYKYSWDITCRDIDFSNSDTFDNVYENESLTNILNDIMNYTETEVLGGVLLDGTILQKYSLQIVNWDIAYFEINDLTALESIVLLCEQNDLYFKMRYVMQPNQDSLVNVYSQLIITDRRGFAPSSETGWSNGIDNTDVFKSKVLNPSYNPLNSLAEPEYLIGESEYKINKNENDIVNYIKIVGNVYDGMYNSVDSDNTSQFLSRYETAVVFARDTYELPYACQDIIFVANQIYSTIEGSPTVNSFQVPAFDFDAMQTGNVCRINLDGIDYFRSISKSVPNTITVGRVDNPAIADSLPSIPSAGTQIEIVNNQVILEDNQVTYASSGVVKNIQQSEKAQIRFLTNSIPPSGYVVIYYTRVQPRKQTVKHTESIAKYGIRKTNPFPVEIKELLTVEQIANLFKKIEFPEPNISVSFTSWRPSNLACQVGWILPVNIYDNISNFFVGNLIVNQIKNKMFGATNYNNSPVIQQDIVLQERKLVLSDIITQIQKAQSVVFNPTGPENKSIKQIEQTSCMDSYKPFDSSKTYIELDTNINTIVYFNFQYFLNFLLKDLTSNNNNGEIVGLANNTYQISLQNDDYSTACYEGDNPDNTSASNGFINIQENVSLDIIDDITFEFVFKLFENDIEVPFYLCQKSFEDDIFNFDVNNSYRIILNNTVGKTTLIRLFCADGVLFLEFDISNIQSLERFKTYYLQFSWDNTSKTPTCVINNNELALNYVDFYDYATMTDYPTTSMFTTINISPTDVKLGTSDNIIGYDTNNILFSRFAIHSEYRTASQGINTYERIKKYFV